MTGRIVETLVFEFSSHEERRVVLDQFKGMLFADATPRVTGMSVDDELKRASLMHEALDRYSSHQDLRDAIDALYSAQNLHEWSWEKHDAEV